MKRRGPSKEVAEFRDKLKSRAVRKYGRLRGWIPALARDSQVPVQTLRTLFSRGQKMPPSDMVTKLEAAAGLLAALPVDTAGSDEDYQIADVTYPKAQSYLREIYRDAPAWVIEWIYGTLEKFWEQHVP